MGDVDDSAAAGMGVVASSLAEQIQESSIASLSTSPLLDADVATPTDMTASSADAAASGMCLCLPCVALQELNMDACADLLSHIMSPEESMVLLSNLRAAHEEMTTTGYDVADVDHVAVLAGKLHQKLVRGGPGRVRQPGSTNWQHEHLESAEPSLRTTASPVELPEGWESALSRSTGEMYYVNTLTAESTYDVPTTPAIADDSLKGESSAASSKQFADADSGLTAQVQVSVMDDGPLLTQTPPQLPASVVRDDDMASVVASDAVCLLTSPAYMSMARDLPTKMHEAHTDEVAPEDLFAYDQHERPKYPWNSLRDRVREAAIELGYDAQHWPAHRNDDEEGGWPTWAELSARQREAAAVMGVREADWTTEWEPEEATVSTVAAVAQEDAEIAIAGPDVEPAMPSPPSEVEAVDEAATTQAELPEGWGSALSRSTGEMYHVNTLTAESTYDVPTAPATADGTAAESSPQLHAATDLGGESDRLPAGWEAVVPPPRHKYVDRNSGLTEIYLRFSIPILILMTWSRYLAPPARATTSTP
jgi:hypothetical protein